MLLPCFPARTRASLTAAACVILLATGLPTCPAATVAADGKGEFPSLQAAIDSAPQGGRLPYVIRLGAGTFNEKIHVERSAGPIHLIGAGADRTAIISDGSDGHRPEHQKDARESKGPDSSATATVRSNDFVAEGIAFENSHGKGAAAPAIAISGRRGIFRNCRFAGWQNTIEVSGGTSYFECCRISGCTDVVSGAGQAWFEKCEIQSLGEGSIAAPSTDEKEPFGFVFSKCRFLPESAAWKTFLARPGGPHGSAVVMNSTLPPGIRPEGWENAEGGRFAEGGNTGPGASTAGRAPGSRLLRPEEMASLCPLLVLGWDLDNGFLPVRVAALPEAERRQWAEYLERSDRNHAADAKALAAELKEAGLKVPVLPPSGPDFKLPSKLAPEWLASPEVKSLADSIISFQTPTGGWSKHVDFSKGPRAPGMHWSSQGSGEVPWHYVGTFDNRSTTEQIRFLMGYWTGSKRPDVKQAFQRGLDYILSAQFPNGGWPQVYPLEGRYHDTITFNDNATTLILRVLDSISQLDPADGLIDPAQLAKARTALQRGVDAVLRLQYKQSGRPTVWCAQFDPLSMAPAAARLKEPASLSGGESVDVVRFLMAIPSPSPEVKASIENALAWFEKSALTGLRKTERDGRTWYDPDPTATNRLWARFYDPATNVPLFSGAQDGLIYKSYNDMQEHNHAGYQFFTDSPEELLGKRQADWRKKLAGGKKNKP